MAGQVNSLYLLTELTGKQASAGRTAVIGTFEMKWRHLWIGIFALVPGLLLTMIFVGPLGPSAILLIPAVEIAAFYLFAKRQRDGLRLHTWRAVLDRKKATTNKFTLCGQVLDLDSIPMVQILSSSTRTPAGHGLRRDERKELDFGGISR